MSSDTIRAVMLESYRCDHFSASSQPMSVAKQATPNHPLFNYRGRGKASKCRTGAKTTSCNALSQQGTSPLNANSSAPSIFLQSQQRHCRAPQGWQPSVQARDRDVRAHIRAPAIPALESQPHTQGTDNTSRLQASRYSSARILHWWGALNATGHGPHSQPVAQG